MAADDHLPKMREALAEAEAALAAGEFPVGVVLTRGDETIVRAHRSASRADGRNELDHAEINALRRLFAERPGIDPASLTVYSTLEPCLMCCGALLLSGIRRIVWAYEDVMGGGANLDLSRLNPLYREMRVELVGGVLRDEALALFQRFFREHDYWRGSLLARYTLEQGAGGQS